MAATTQVSDDDLVWDTSHLPIGIHETATDDAIAALDAALDRRPTVRRVREVLAGDADARIASPTDWARTLRHAPSLVAVTSSSSGFSEITYDADGERYIVAGYSALQALNGNDPRYAEEVSADTAQDILHGSPSAVTLDEASLLTGGDA